MPKIIVSRGERIIEVEISDEAARTAAVDIAAADIMLEAMGQRGASPEVITEKRKLAAALAGTSNNKDKKG